MKDLNATASGPAGKQFLDEMDKIVPWKGLCEVIEPFYPKPEGAGRPPIGLQRMLRIHFLQHWFNLSDPRWKRRCMTRAPCAASSA